RVWLLYGTPYVVYMVYLMLLRAGTATELDWLGWWALGGGVLAALLLALTLTVGGLSYRDNRDLEARQKIRSGVFGALPSGIGGLALWNIPAVALGHPLISANMLGLLVLPFPLSMAIAILRHRLFDIDTILNRTLVYGGLTGIVAGLYVLIVGM